MTHTSLYTLKSMAKRQKSEEIRSTDGRRHNKRLPSKVQIKGQVTSQPARLNEAKKKQIPIIAEKVAIKSLGGAAGIFEQLAELIKSGESDTVKLNAIKMYLEHLEKGEQSAPTSRTAPTINFSFNQQPDEKTIDIQSEEVDEE
jgi:hypothetical protein